MRKVLLVLLIGGSLALMGCGQAEQPAAENGETAESELKPQTHCPIMGSAINRDLYVDHEGKRIYVCCPPCVEQVNADPEAALRKLEEMGQHAEEIEAEPEETHQREVPAGGG